MRVFFGVNESGVAWWRGKQPALKLMEKGLCDVELFSAYDIDPVDAESMVVRSDVIYVPSPTGVEAVTQFLNYFQYGKKSIADFDDDLFECHPFNPGYKTLGLKPIKVRLPGQPEVQIWEDGKKGFSLKDNHIRFNSYVDILNVVDTITTPSNYLQKVLRSHTERSLDDFEVLPNSIDFNLFKPFDQRRKDHSKLRIGWAASDSHLLEGFMMHKILEKLYKDRPNDFQFVILGSLDEMRESFSCYPIEWHRFAELQAYPMKLASLELDIAISPLVNVKFNHSKSPLKWSEYSAMKVPCVLSDVEPYKCVRDGVDGLLAKNEQEFCEKIYTLMDSPDLRRSMSQTAFDRNYEEFNLDKNVYLWLQCFETALSKKRTLNYKGSKIYTMEEIHGSRQEVSV